jgi:hypothetical protein
MIAYNRIKTQLGEILAASSGKGLCWLSLSAGGKRIFWAG